MTLGQTIKAKREALGLTQQELAQRLFVSRQTVSRWESGSRCPDLIMAKKIAMVLNISLDELIPGEALASYVPPKEPALDLSCIKVMLTGLLLVLAGTFLAAADFDATADFAVVCFFIGIVTFLAGLFLPQQRGAVSKDDSLPQKKCARCGKEYDFDYPKCPYCDYEGGAQ